MTLSQWLERNGILSRDFAQRMDVSIHAVNKWRNQSRIPRRKMLMKIMETTKGKVSWQDWDKA